LCTITQAYLNTPAAVGGPIDEATGLPAQAESAEERKFNGILVAKGQNVRRKKPKNEVL
jgi:hypothetical protein